MEMMLGGARGIKGRTLGRLVVGPGQYRVQGRRHEGSGITE